MRLITLLLALALAFPAAAHAHGGGLDGNGCHYDRKRGGYHCHKGPMAGQTFASENDMRKAMQSGQTRENDKKGSAPKSGRKK